MSSLGFLRRVGEDRSGTLGARAVLLFCLLALGFPSCTPVGSPGTAPEPSGPPIPALGSGELSGSAARRGRALLREARDSLDAGALVFARSGATAVIEDYPGLSGSGEALGILAESELLLGDYPAAVAAARRFRSLLSPEHPLYPDQVMLEARALREEGREVEALEPLLTLPPESPVGVVAQAREWILEATPAVSGRELESLTESLPSTSPLRGVMATEWSVALYLRGELAEAQAWADSALAMPLQPREEERARGVLEGRLDEVLGLPLVLGVVLPRSGVSPGAIQYGEWVLEGIQVAVEEFQDELSRPVQVEVVDDRGSALGGRTAIRSLDGFGAIGALGFLGQEVLQEAAETRESGFPLVSPFAFLPPDEAPGVYSLSGPDPGGAKALARAAWDLELKTVAIVRPSTEEARADAEAFMEEFHALGGVVPRDIVFDSGGTFFQPQFQEVEALLPDGLFLPLTPRDISLLAPQITFYGVDTLGAQILGTSGWAEDAVVLDVDSRHTDGVIAATTRLTQDDTEAFRRFEEAYEALFHKTLRSRIPAFGFDAAALILKGLEAGPANPGELMEAMEGIRGFPGATGILSVEGGRISREPLMVRIQDHELIYISRQPD